MFYPLSILLIFIIRYNWLVLFLILDGILIKHRYFPNVARKYQDIKLNIDHFLSNNSNSKYSIIKERLYYWYKYDNFKSKMIIFSILIIPLVIEIIFLYLIPMSNLVLFFLWKLIIFVIRYCWLILMIMMNELVLVEYNYFPNYIRLYNSIKETIINWHEDKIFRSVVILISIFGGPFMLEMCFIWLMPIMNLFIFVLWSLFLFLIRYCWLILILIINRIFEENEIFQNYISKSIINIIQQIGRWSDNNKLKIGLVIFLTIAGPFILEILLFYGFKAI
ncbi:unnamed protein product [Rotaria sp. Silwood1]|nr:unnamed protein product [Rotaria sp. Silwood1]CAF3525147.1 unnamed protein product [Rotaria sp. Silwood1]CAF4936974.1 unnamed protein product [Rotaria sp. Silwood1]